MIDSLFTGAPAWNVPLLLLLAKATIILVAALGITMAMQRASAGARHLVWLVTLGTLLLVPALTAWGPLRLGILPAARGSESVNITRAGTPNPVPLAIEQPAPVVEGRSNTVSPIATETMVPGALERLLEGRT